MKCPHCQVDFFDNWRVTVIGSPRDPVMIGGTYNNDAIYAQAQMAVCPNCKGPTVTLDFATQYSAQAFTSQAFPRGGKFPAAPIEVPSNIGSDYAEANEVLTISPKASAALARRCLQAILSAHGYNSRDLVKQVESVIGETDPGKALPIALRENIDAIRNFGNFSAHPITDQTTLQIVDVEEGEAEWSLEILNDLFNHYYVAPARAAARRAALGTKLAGAGKPPMKQ